jgi:hypothetical protein
MPEPSIDALREAIRNLHGCDSRHVESVPVTETREGETAWDGVVEVFDLIDHSTAERAYAWAHAVDESDKRRFVAVLHEGPIDSPQEAVRAAIVQEYRERE